MDPLTALLVAALFADLLSGGWVHSTLIGGAAGAGREAWRDLAPRIPPSVAKSRTARAAAATGRGLWYGGGAVVRGTRAGFAPGVRAGHERWRERRHWWHRAAELGGRLRLWVRGRQERPVEGSAPTSAGPGPGHPSPPGGGPGGGRPGVVGPRSPTTTGTTTTGSPGAGGGGATAPVVEPPPVATGGGFASATQWGKSHHRPPVLRLVPPDATTTDTTTTTTTTDTTDPSTTDPSTTTTEEDTTVTATTVDVTTPNTSTEDVPAHIAAGLDLADAIEDIAEQYTSALEDTVRRHIESAESIPGFPPSLQGDWEDGVMQPLNMISTLLAQAAEAARGAAEAERKALEQSVEAADNAPSDSDLPQSVLRTN